MLSWEASCIISAVHSRKTDQTDIILQPQNCQHPGVVHLNLQTNQI